MSHARATRLLHAQGAICDALPPKRFRDENCGGRVGSGVALLRTYDVRVCPLDAVTRGRAGLRQGLEPLLRPTGWFLDRESQQRRGRLRKKKAAAESAEQRGGEKCRWPLERARREVADP